MKSTKSMMRMVHTSERDDYKDRGYEWTEEDSWDALTDGMYGDMPRNPMEYDAMMDAMGF